MPVADMVKEKFEGEGLVYQLQPFPEIVMVLF